MILGPIAAAMLAAQPSPAPAPLPGPPPPPEGRWLPVGSLNGVSVFLDETSLGATGDLRRARLRMVGDMQPAGARSAIGTAEVDCRNRTGRPIEISFFDARGALMETRSMADGRAPVPTQPGSLDELVQERVCGRSPAAPVI
jgi:hypothetical protein